MSKVKIIRFFGVLALTVYSAIGYSQIELKIEQSQYDDTDSAAVFYCQNDSSSKEIYRFNFDSFLFNEISWFYDTDKSLFYYTTTTLLRTCSSSGNNELKIVFGCYFLQCPNQSRQFIKVEVISNQMYPNFKDIVINGNELIFLLNKEEVKRELLVEVSKNKLSEFLK